MKNKINIFISGILYLFIYSYTLRIAFNIFERFFSFKEILSSTILYLIIGGLILFFGTKTSIVFLKKRMIVLQDILILLGITFLLFILNEWIDLVFLKNKYSELLDELSVTNRNNLFNLKNNFIYIFRFLLLLALAIKANRKESTID